MKKLIGAMILGAGVALTWPLASQDLSSQVLALLTRNNYWSGVNTYAKTVGITLESGSFAPTTVANRLYNVGSNLYWNGVLVQPASGAGTVTSVGLAAPGQFTVSGSPVTSAGTLTLAWANQSANTLLAGPIAGGATTPTFRALVGADLPVPSTTTLGGVKAIVAIAHEFITSITTAGQPVLAQPTFTDLTAHPTTFAGYGISDSVTNLMTAISSSVSGSGAFCLVTSCTLVTPALGTPASGVATNITGLVATNLASGTVPAARMPALTGDVTSTVGTVATTLANTAVTPASYGDATHVATFTVDGKGRLTAAASVSITTPTVNLASGVTGVLPPANGGTGASTVPSNGFLPIGNGTTYTSAALTGTTSQVIVTNGAGTITLSLPQSINTTSSPHFACVGAGVGCSGSEVLNYSGGQASPGYVAAGNCGAALTINWNSGGIQTSTLNAGTCTFSFTNPIVGNLYQLVVTQDATGGRLVTWPGTVTWFGGSAPTLSTGANKQDLCSFLWNGTAYLGSCLIGA